MVPTRRDCPPPAPSTSGIVAIEMWRGSKTATDVCLQISEMPLHVSVDRESR